MADFTPHTEEEIASMLSFLGIESTESLFSSIPAAVRLAGGLEMPNGISEPDVLYEMTALADANREKLVCFAGAGAYDHEIPAAVRSLASRSEFVTSYTPYQPEVAQGVLEALFEYQTMVARLAGLDVANASLYDGASALVEAVNLAVSSRGDPGVWISAGVNPRWRKVLSTFAKGSGHKISLMPLVDGTTRWADPEPGQHSSSHEASQTNPGSLGALPESLGAVVVAYPNYLGCLENLSQARSLADWTGAMLVVAFDPICSSIVKSPGEWGADIAVGEGQPLGNPLGFGGPYLGILAARKEHVRRLPGRLVGESIDVEGRRAYVTTLRAREQDIRREKASSNVCTNQTLMAVTAAIQLGWLGASGLAEVAVASSRAARYCRELLCGIDGVVPLSSAPTVREFAVYTGVPASELIGRVAEDGFLAGVALPEELSEGRQDGLLIATTERRTAAQIEGFAAAVERALR